MNELRNVNWTKLLIFYGSILVFTYLSRQLPNVLTEVANIFTDIHLPWNFNHGIAILFVSAIFYKFYFKNISQISFLGNNPIKSILFPIILFSGYGIYGINNDQEINPHSWALIFCTFTLIYDLMEEYTWRGYLYENLNNINLIIKGIISGIFWALWHLLIFSNYEQYGGFTIFLLFCIIFSTMLNFTVKKTNSLLVAATVHALLIRTNEATAICAILFLILLVTWNKKLKFKR